MKWLILFQCITLSLLSYLITPSSSSNQQQQSQQHHHYHYNESLYPSMSTSMSDLQHFLYMLEHRIPFAYAHFNDGEISLLDATRNDTTTDFGWQHSSLELANALRSAMIHTAPHFYLGIPCFCEFGGFPTMKALVTLQVAAHTSHMYVAEGDPITHAWGAGGKLCSSESPVFNYTLSLNPSLKKGRLTVATVFINGNYEYALRQLTRILQAQSIPTTNNYTNTTTTAMYGNTTTNLIPTATIDSLRYNLTQQQQPQLPVRGIHVVVNMIANISSFPFPISSVQRIPNKHAFDSEYQSLRTGGNFLANVSKGDVVMIMAGPLGRILASEWSLLRHDLTILELGSFWDAVLWKRSKHNLSKDRACMSQRDVKVTLSETKVS